MCIVIIHRRPDAAWPLILAGNRDEMSDRPWLPPARHWPDRADVVGGLDELGGGSWLGLNDSGVVAVILNRIGTLGPAAGKRSRGELVLEALDHGDAVDAAEALAQINPRAYRPFNMVIADDRDAYWLAHREAEGRRPIAVRPLPPGFTMITGLEANDHRDPRIARFLPRFMTAELPDPAAGAWTDWEALLADRSVDDGAGPKGGMCFTLDNGFATGSGALIALPNRRFPGGDQIKPIWRFSDGPPDRVPWRAIHL